MMIKSIKLNLAERLKDRRFRERFIATMARDEIASQIRELRHKRGLNTQAKFAREAKMQQSAISRIERADYNGWTFRTLVRVAVALNARLRVSLEPLEQSVAKAARSATEADLQMGTILDGSDVEFGNYVDDATLTNTDVQYEEDFATGAAQ
ncbi:MAG TPA: helix-turn-helix transcriptional regulator [Vicinamibacterales bacterium]|nr:helix-turn-helix transcriptional regulator [Vicinamibacterales bacterium]